MLIGGDPSMARSTRLGLVGVFVSLLCALPALAIDETTCTKCVCEQRVRAVQCCRPVSEGAVLNQAQPSPSPEPIDACFSSPDTAQCGEICAVLAPDPPPPCQGPPCAPGEQVVLREELYVVGIPVVVSGEGACTDCPPSETGQCDDAVDNDEWLEMAGAADCFDSDCSGDPACPARMAPVASGRGLAIIVSCLLGLGVAVLARRAHGKSRS